MRNPNYEIELEELSSAEDFLEHFAISYDKSVVQVNRLHILKRFHDYLEKDPEMPVLEICPPYYATWLAKAYQDFVVSDARTEKVFKVFHQSAAQKKPTFISIDEILKS